MESDEERGEEVAVVPLDGEKLRARIHHHLRTCSAAVKKARAFEIQRTIKKLKAATEEEKKGLESQVQALKASQHSQVAAIAIKNKLVKARLLPRTKAEKEDEQFPLAGHVEELEASLVMHDSTPLVDAEDEKAKSKLLSNKMVSEEVSNIIKAISAILQGEEPAKKSKLESKRELSLKSDTLLSNKGSIQGKHVKIRDDPKAASQIDPGAGSADEIALGLISSDDSEESGVPQAALKAGVQKKKPVAVHNGKRQHDLDERLDPERPSKQRRRIAQDSASDEDSSDGETDSERRLLPALSTGFVGGRGFNLGRGSEDEWSDGDAELESIDEDADGTGNRKEARKNRMGQRARRAIWEKKFGKGANHLKLLGKETRQRVPSRRQDGIRSRKDQGGLPDRDAGWSGALRKEPATLPIPAKYNPPKAEAEMHPSWIAKQKQKEKAEAAAQSRGTAKKIVFD